MINQMAKGFLNRCLACGVTASVAFVTENGKCRCCAGHPEDPMLDLMPEPPKWPATHHPKMEAGTNVWWMFQRTCWVPLAPYEYPNQLLPWLKNKS